ncbi:SHOCT domain-containing protein [Mycobacterium sp. CPCC 205372]|uniref:SHOCT domain-containing protein n=1 Tax=Mycobacterium hippophais TaxID=3016340 RepID=A0ABT4PPF5_9MYCO|nr:SHOCT domain-containing protein [Mycobacterium hippophais]MCZ8378439.1 SHOCT domain-containing protein [Mycobacterium hippophais]
MQNGRLAARVVIGVAVVTMVSAIIGFVVTIVMNAFVFDDFDAYGEVPVPGRGSVQLPAGEVTISFHTFTGGTDGGFPVPPLQLRIDPPEGVAEPDIAETGGSITTVNGDTRLPVWVAQIPAEGRYGVQTDGEVNGYINPQLSFGHGSEYGWLPWVFAGLFVISVVELAAGLMWSHRAGKRARPVTPLYDFGATAAGPGGAVAHGYAPTEQGIRLEQLNTLAALRDSGALTEAEFEAEKRRILDG